MLEFNIENSHCIDIDKRSNSQIACMSLCRNAVEWRETIRLYLQGRSSVRFNVSPAKRLLRCPRRSFLTNVMSSQFRLSVVGDVRALDEEG